LRILGIPESITHIWADEPQLPSHKTQDVEAPCMPAHPMFN
jgi:hypothetical protein